MDEQKDLFAIKVSLENAFTDGVKHGYVGRGAVCEHVIHAYGSYSEEYMRKVAEKLKIDGATVVKLKKDMTGLDYLTDVLKRWDLEKETIHKDDRCPIGSEQVFGLGFDQDCYKMEILNEVKLYKYDKYDVILAPAEMCEGEIILYFAEKNNNKPRQDDFMTARFGR